MPEEVMSLREIHGTAQWIIETTLEAEKCLGTMVPDYEGVTLCLEAIATYAKNIFDATQGRD